MHLSLFDHVCWDESIQTATNAGSTTEMLAMQSNNKPYQMFYSMDNWGLRWPNTVCARFTDSVSDAIKRVQGLW